MYYQTSDNSLYSYLFKQLEMAFSIAIILAVAVAEYWLQWPWALVIFALVAVFRATTVRTEMAEISSRELTVDGQQVTLQSALTQQQFLLADFKILLYKRRGKKISVFILMSEQSSLKIEYFRDMQQLYELFSQQVPMCKKIPWWQRL
ncbi:MAG: hypothetical protein OFPI_02560 [Osedax symbiont Rs2]|nr:MAG: hypothetical protein OFPI_02560 [Osedax symbiont Rs2]